jgi:hypothetical protein
VSAARRRIPEGELLEGSGYRIMLAPGRYRASSVPVYLEGVSVRARGGDVVHCELCDHLLIRRSRLVGPGETAETLKVNQSQHVYVERSNVFGAGDNAIDFVAVQHGHCWPTASTTRATGARTPRAARRTSAWQAPRSTPAAPAASRPVRAPASSS